MFFRRYTSLLISTSIFVQSISPALAMYDDSEKIEKKISKKKIYTKITNISEMDETGVVVQPGDWVILDIDRTVLQCGRGSNQDILNLDPKVLDMVKNWKAVNATELDPKKHITILFLTARNFGREDETKEQLKKAGFPENIEIIFAPNDYQLNKKTPTKGKALINRLEATQLKPRRMIMIDDLTENLSDVYETLQNNVTHKNIPLKLLKRKVDRKICESSDKIIQFDKKLTDLTYIRPIGGGSGGVHVLKDKKGRLFTFKAASTSEQMKEEVLADALYRSLKVKVPAFAVYDHLPDIQEIRNACTGPGPYRLAQFIEDNEAASRDIKAQEMRKNFVADALLSNFDIVIDNFKNIALDKSATLWRLDNGGSLRFRASGESKFGYENWEPHTVKELETMVSKTTDGAFVYGSLTETEIKEQVQDILNKSPALFKTFDEMAKKLHLNNPSEVREMLRLRLDYLAKKYLLSPILPIMDGFKAPRFGAGILTYSIDPHTGQTVILLCKRVGHNYWCNPGGESDLNKGIDSDKTLTHTAVREVQEESLGYLSYDIQELANKPSHAILNHDNVFYRMYIAQHPYVAEEQFKKAPPNTDYGWKLEYSEYRWVPLDQFLLGIEQNQLVIEESKKTIQIGDMILYPYFWEMLQESPVKNTLESICAGKKVRPKHTHDGRVQPIILPLSVEAEKQQLAETVVKKGFVLGQVKSRNPIAYRFQMTPPVFIGPKQRNVINIFIKNNALFLKQTHGSPVKVVPFSSIAYETDEFDYVEEYTYQGQENGQKVILLPEVAYNQMITCVKGGIELSHLEKKALLIALGLALPADNEPDHCEEVQSMSGFLKNHEAKKLREILQNAPYTQTQAYLRHIMGEEVYESLKGMSELEVDKFLDEYSKFDDMRLLYKIRLHDFSKSLENDVLEVLLKDNDLYLKIKNKNIWKITVQQEDESTTLGLTSAEYDLLKRAVTEKRINLVNYDLNKALLKYADQVGYTPKLPIDPHYKQVLKKAMDAEKQNREKIMFLHATDPLTTFLYDIITANRSQLKNLGANVQTTFRCLEKKFASILDVEAFISTYTMINTSNEKSCVDNYATVKDTHYADLGLSVNPFLFGNDGNPLSSTHYLFHNVQSVSPTNQESLFNAFMTATGIPGKWKDYQALFQQYYLRDYQHNAKLFQIFVDPQIVDCVAYTAIAGGDVLNVTMDNKPYHGFAKTMAELRTAPEKSDEKIQNRTSGKLKIETDLNNLQGRLFLNPKIFLDPKYVNVNTYWRHPMSEDMEISYYNKLNGQVSQDLTCWLSKHCYFDPQTFVESIPSLKKSYRYVYEGKMGLPYMQQESKSILPSAIRDGNTQLIKQILEKNPEININEKLPNITYRGHGAANLSPLEFLTVDTPNFSEIIKIFLEKGLNSIIIFNNEIQSKILNEVFLYQDKLSEELVYSFKFLLNSEKNKSVHALIKSMEKGYKNLISHILKETNELDANYIDTNELLILANTLKTNATLKSLKMSKDISLCFVSILMHEKEEEYKQAPWFKDAWDAYISSPVIEIIQATLKQKIWDHLPKIIGNANTDVLDLTKLDFGGKVTEEAKTAWHQALVKGLKANSTLKGLHLADHDMHDLMAVLLSSPSGPYQSVPWFTEAQANLFKNPEAYVRYHTNRQKNYGAILSLLKTSPEEIELGKYVKDNNDFLNFLTEGLSKGEPISQLNLSDMRGIPMAKLADALKVNTKLISLNLSGCDFYEKEVQLLNEGLKNNTTLAKLTLSKKDMFAVIADLMKDREGAFRKTPWLESAWKEIIKDSLEENIKLAHKQKQHELIRALIVDTKVDSLDLSNFGSNYDSWMDPVLNSIKYNNTIHTLKIDLSKFNDEKSMKKLTALLQESKTLKCLDFGYTANLSDKVVGILLETLKKDISLEDLTFSRQLRLEILNQLYPYKDQLFGGIKKWANQGILDLMSDPNATVRSYLIGYGQKVSENLLAFVLGNLTELKMENIYGNIVTLLNGLKTNKTISALDLGFSGSHYFSITGLAKILEEKDQIHTLHLHTEYSFSNEDIHALSAALIKNKTFKTLDLSKNSLHQNKLSSENLTILTDAMKQTNFSKTLKVAEESELDLLNEVMPHKGLMTSHWLDWMNPLWEKRVENPQAGFVNAIQKAHQNIAQAILKMGTISALEVNNDLWSTSSKVLLMDILKTDKILQSVKIDDYGHEILMELFPLKNSLSKGAQIWVESTWNALMENPEKSFKQALESYGGKEKLAGMILNWGDIKTLNLETDEFLKLSTILRDNNTLENLSISGQVYDKNTLDYLFSNIGKNKNLSLKILDLRGCIFINKISKNIFKSIEQLLKKKKDLTIIIPKDAVEEKTLTDTMNSLFVDSGQLVIK